ncbi:MAG TPA: helix-hairpin-helix domain-containing protein [Phycisphaerae bacterium]|nr:helix-hairpin-helix domain-containing protein [Phycisphaerae bacterium]
MLLEKIQGQRPGTATVILADETTETVGLTAEWPAFEQRLAEAEAIIDRRTATDLAIFSGCGQCVWQELCHDDAVTRKDVTLVADLRRSTKPALAEAGIITVDDLAKAESDGLSDLRGIGTKTAERLVLQAKAQTDGQVIPIGTVKLPKSAAELYDDIEGEPALDVDYLQVPGRQLREPEVESMRLAGLVDEYVARLEVAVNDA